MRNYILDFTIELVVPLFIVLIVGMFLIAPLVYFPSKIACEKYSEITGRSTKFHAIEGCFVQVDNNWYTQEEYKYTLVNR